VVSWDRQVCVVQARGVLQQAKENVLLQDGVAVLVVTRAFSRQPESKTVQLVRELARERVRVSRVGRIRECMALQT